MKTRVLDTWPILEWLNGREPAATLVQEMFSAAELGEASLLMSAINAGEVYYFLRKTHRNDSAESWRESCPALPIRIEVPTLDEIWKAGALKGRYPISYADAFAAGIAQKYRCSLVTGDPEFRSVDGLHLEWIGNPA